MEREGPSDGSPGDFFPHGSDCVLLACTPMGWRDQILERFIGHRDTCRLRLAAHSFRSCRVVYGRPSGLAGCSSWQTGHTRQLLVQLLVRELFFHQWHIAN